MLQIGYSRPSFFGVFFGGGRDARIYYCLLDAEVWAFGCDE